MNPLFQNLTWSLELPPPWTIQAQDGRLKITQPEGAGVMRINVMRKNEGAVTEAETLALLQRASPAGSAAEKVQCGDFVGYVTAYVDWATSRSWRAWCVACGQDVLEITYTCWRGEEELEAEDAAALLQSLRTRG